MLKMLLCVSLLLGGCASSGPKRLNGAEAYYEEGMEALESSRCVEAAEKLQRLVNNFPGSRLVPDAQYHLGEAYFCAEDYVNAVFEYQRLADTYPASQWVDEAQFKIAECYYEQARRAELDQSETHDALSYYRIFLEDNPDSPLAGKARARIAECRARLAKKLYLAARLYQRQGHSQAAELYYSELLVDYPDTEYYYKSLFQLGELAMERDDRQAARRYWAEVARDSGSQDLRREAGERLAKEFKSSDGGEN